MQWVEIDMMGSGRELVVASPPETSEKIFDIDFPAWGRAYSGAEIRGVYAFESQDFVAILLDNDLYLLNEFNDEGNCVFMRHRDDLDAAMASIGAERLDFFCIDPSDWP